MQRRNTAAGRGRLRLQSIERIPRIAGWRRLRKVRPHCQHDGPIIWAVPQRQRQVGPENVLVLQGVHAADDDERDHGAHVKDEDGQRHHRRLDDAQDGKGADARHEQDREPIDADGRVQVVGVGHAFGCGDDCRCSVGE